jgi:threonine/homoserine/homoserine lactone efflux protein
MASTRANISGKSAGMFLLTDPLYAFVLAGLFSPGPNVILITTSGARFGFKATLPHVFGVVLGVGITAGLTALGIGALLLAAPALEWTLKLIASGWITYMAYKLAIARPSATPDPDERPFTFVQAVLFQWVNPKVWAIALAASAGFASSLQPLQEALRIGSAFSGTNFFVCLFWSAAGTLLAYLLKTPTAWRVFNLLMAAALLAAAIMVFLS